jgi:hypothetical protein
MTKQQIAEVRRRQAERRIRYDWWDTRARDEAEADLVLCLDGLEALKADLARMHEEASWRDLRDSGGLPESSTP